MGDSGHKRVKSPRNNGNAACKPRGIKYDRESGSWAVPHTITVARTPTAETPATQKPMARPRTWAGTSSDRYNGAVVVRILTPRSGYELALEQIGMDQMVLSQFQNLKTAQMIIPAAIQVISTPIMKSVVDLDNKKIRSWLVP